MAKEKSLFDALIEANDKLHEYAADLITTAKINDGVAEISIDILKKINLVSADGLGALSNQPQLKDYYEQLKLWAEAPLSILKTPYYEGATTITIPEEAFKYLLDPIINQMANLVHNAAIDSIGPSKQLKKCQVTKLNPDNAIAVGKYCSGATNSVQVTLTNEKSFTVGGKKFIQNYPQLLIQPLGVHKVMPSLYKAGDEIKMAVEYHDSYLNHTGSSNRLRGTRERLEQLGFVCNLGKTAGAKYGQVKDIYCNIDDIAPNTIRQLALFFSLLLDGDINLPDDDEKMYQVVRDKAWEKVLEYDAKYGDNIWESKIPHKFNWHELAQEWKEEQQFTKNPIYNDLRQLLYLRDYHHMIEEKYNIDGGSANLEAMKMILENGKKAQAILVKNNWGNIQYNLNQLESLVKAGKAKSISSLSDGIGHEVHSIAYGKLMAAKEYGHCQMDHSVSNISAGNLAYCEGLLDGSSAQPVSGTGGNSWVHSSSPNKFTVTVGEDFYPDFHYALKIGTPESEMGTFWAKEVQKALKEKFTFQCTGKQCTLPAENHNTIRQVAAFLSNLRGADANIGEECAKKAIEDAYKAALAQEKTKGIFTFSQSPIFSSKKEWVDKCFKEYGITPPGMTKEEQAVLKLIGADKVYGGCSFSSSEVLPDIGVIKYCEGVRQNVQGNINAFMQPNMSLDHYFHNTTDKIAGIKVTTEAPGKYSISLSHIDMRDHLPEKPLQAKVVERLQSLGLSCPSNTACSTKQPVNETQLRLIASYLSSLHHAYELPLECVPLAEKHAYDAADKLKASPTAFQTQTFPHYAKDWISTVCAGAPPPAPKKETEPVTAATAGIEDIKHAILALISEGKSHSKGWMIQKVHQKIPGLSISLVQSAFTALIDEHQIELVTGKEDWWQQPGPQAATTEQIIPVTNYMGSNIVNEAQKKHASKGFLVGGCISKIKTAPTQIKAAYCLGIPTYAKLDNGNFKSTSGLAELTSLAGQHGIEGSGIVVFDVSGKELTITLPLSLHDGLVKEYLVNSEWLGFTESKTNPWTFTRHIYNNSTAFKAALYLSQLTYFGQLDEGCKLKAVDKAIKVAESKQHSFVYPYQPLSWDKFCKLGEETIPGTFKWEEPQFEVNIPGGNMVLPVPHIKKLIKQGVGPKVIKAWLMDTAAWSNLPPKLALIEAAADKVIEHYFGEQKVEKPPLDKELVKAEILYWLKQNPGKGFDWSAIYHILADKYTESSLPATSAEAIGELVEGGKITWDSAKQIYIPLPQPEPAAHLTKDFKWKKPLESFQAHGINVMVPEENIKQLLKQIGIGKDEIVDALTKDAAWSLLGGYEPLDDEDAVKVVEYYAAEMQPKVIFAPQVKEWLLNYFFTHQMQDLSYADLADTFALVQAPGFGYQSLDKALSELVAEGKVSKKVVYKGGSNNGTVLYKYTGPTPAGLAEHYGAMTEAELKEWLLDFIFKAPKPHSEEGLNTALQFAAVKPFNTVDLSVALQSLVNEGKVIKSLELGVAVYKYAAPSPQQVAAQDNIVDKAIQEHLIENEKLLAQYNQQSADWKEKAKEKDAYKKLPKLSQEIIHNLIDLHLLTAHQNKLPYEEMLAKIQHDILDLYPKLTPLMIKLQTDIEKKAKIAKGLLPECQETCTLKVTKYEDMDPGQQEAVKNDLEKEIVNGMPMLDAIDLVAETYGLEKTNNLIATASIVVEGQKKNELNTMELKGAILQLLEKKFPNSAPTFEVIEEILGQDYGFTKEMLLKAIEQLYQAHEIIGFGAGFTLANKAPSGEDIKALVFNSIPYPGQADFYFIKHQVHQIYPFVVDAAVYEALEQLVTTGKVAPMPGIPGMYTVVKPGSGVSDDAIIAFLKQNPHSYYSPAQLQENLNSKDTVSIAHQLDGLASEHKIQVKMAGPGIYYGAIKAEKKSAAQEELEPFSIENGLEKKVIAYLKKSASIKNPKDEVDTMKHIIHQDMSIHWPKSMLHDIVKIIVKLEKEGTITKSQAEQGTWYFKGKKAPPAKADPVLKAGVLEYLQLSGKMLSVGDISLGLLNEAESSAVKLALGELTQEGKLTWSIFENKYQYNGPKGPGLGFVTPESKGKHDLLKKSISAYLKQHYNTANDEWVFWDEIKDQFSGELPEKVAGVLNELVQKGLITEIDSHGEGTDEYQWIMKAAPDTEPEDESPQSPDKEVVKAWITKYLSEEHASQQELAIAIENGTEFGDVELGDYLNELMVEGKISHDDNGYYVEEEEPKVSFGGHKYSDLTQDEKNIVNDEISKLVYGGNEDIPTIMDWLTGKFKIGTDDELQDQINHELEMHGVPETSEEDDFEPEDVPWDWYEAFQKFSFGDGDGVQHNEEIGSILEEHGWSVTYANGIHNNFITSMTKGGKTIKFTGYEEEGELVKKIPPEILADMPGYQATKPEEKPQTLKETLLDIINSAPYDFNWDKENIEEELNEQGDNSDWYTAIYPNLMELMLEGKIVHTKDDTWHSKMKLSVNLAGENVLEPEEESPQSAKKEKYQDLSDEGQENVAQAIATLINEGMDKIEIADKIMEKYNLEYSGNLVNEIQAVFKLKMQEKESTADEGEQSLVDLFNEGVMEKLLQTGMTPDGVVKLFEGTIGHTKLKDAAKKLMKSATQGDLKPGVQTFSSLPSWVQNKIKAIAHDMLISGEKRESVVNYIAYNFYLDKSTVQDNIEAVREQATSEFQQAVDALKFLMNGEALGGCYVANGGVKDLQPGTVAYCQGVTKPSATSLAGTPPPTAEILDNGKMVIHHMSTQNIVLKSEPGSKDLSLLKYHSPEGQDYNTRRDFVKELLEEMRFDCEPAADTELKCHYKVPADGKVTVMDEANMRKAALFLSAIDQIPYLSQKCIPAALEYAKNHAIAISKTQKPWELNVYPESITEWSQLVCSKLKK